MAQIKCKVCKHPYEPIVANQQYCSATCARAVKDIDELGRVYMELDSRLVRSMLGDNNAKS